MISLFILKLFGWKIEGKFPDVKKAIVLVAPHTSMYDFVLGRLFFNVMRIRVNFLIKKELFFFPLGYLLKSLGALPVQRGSVKSNMADIVTQKLLDSKSMYIVITPEGTRKKTANWKRGFYQIAQKSNVPLILGAIDYKKKLLIIGNQFHITGDYNDDIKKIKRYYVNITPRHPENFTVGNID